MKSRYAVVVIGYNRLNSLMRLCESLKRVDSLGDRLDLIISLDFYEDKSIVNYAMQFTWEKGQKKIVAHEERLGLKKHVLSCGRFLEEYEAIVVLEDDLYVSSQMYSYMRQAVAMYQDSEEIAGISLYSYGRNEINGLGFKADYSKYDVFFMQLAQSWGQVWMRKQWNDFYDWYKCNCNNDMFTDIHIPKSIKNWSKQSWLKYHIAYCAVKNKYFVYPYMSLTTCFSEAGEHTKYADITQQVPLYEGIGYTYRFAAITDEDIVKYDSFFERMNMERYIPEIQNEEKVCVDLYGNKYNFEGYKYILTSNKYDNLCEIKRYGLFVKPQEMNVILDIKGDDIFLYDISTCADELREGRCDKWRKWEYYSSPKVTSDINMLKMYFYKLIRKFFGKRNRK